MSLFLMAGDYGRDLILAHTNAKSTALFVCSFFELIIVTGHREAHMASLPHAQRVGLHYIPEKIIVPFTITFGFCLLCRLLRPRR